MNRNYAAILVAFACSAVAADWPQWRGPDRTGLSKETGRKNSAKEFGGKVGFWAYSESVLVDGDHVICTPGGESAGLAAFNKKNGDVVWTSKLPEGDVADYASVIAVEGGGHKQYIG